MLQALHLPVIVHKLHELTEKEAILVLNHLLRRQERHNAILLGRELRILVQIVDRGAVVLSLGKGCARHLLFYTGSLESPFYAHT